MREIKKDEVTELQKAQANVKTQLNYWLHIRSSINGLRSDQAAEWQRANSIVWNLERAHNMMACAVSNLRAEWE